MKLSTSLRVSLLLTLGLGLFLWFSSDAPPYGPPYNELSNDYWCYIIDIAHKWRAFDFKLWDPALAGGTSLFTSGQYPLLNPTNILSFVLSDDHFYLFKLIEPYALGFFFMALLLIDIFRLPLLYACFGALFFLGLPLGIHTTLPESPLTLWGCFLFPAMVYVYFKFLNSQKYLNTALVGALIALQFAGEGVTQVPQVLIWWWIFLFVQSVGRRSNGLLFSLKEWAIHGAVLTTMAAGLWGIQFIPTFEFFKHESSRVLGYYSINNFPLMGGDQNVPSFWGLLRPFLFHQPFGNWQVPLGLCCLLAALIFVLLRQGLNLSGHSSVLGPLWLATGIYIVVPTCSQALSSWLPLARAVLENISTFTFRYGIHIFDFTLALTLSLIFGANPKVPLPAFRQWASSAIGALLVTAAFFMAWSCYQLNHKGAKTNLADYHMDSPEYVFYKNAQGQYYLPYEAPVWMADSYNLLWNVYGTSGFLPLTPYRISNFMTTYHFKDRMPGQKHVYRPHMKIIDPSGMLSKWFPVDFTTIGHGKVLPWDNFNLKVKGELFDVWVRQAPQHRVYFGNRWKKVSLEELVWIMDKQGPNHVVYMENKDAADFHLPQPSGAPVHAAYSHFAIRQNKITFDVTTASDLIVVVPWMYQRYWKILANGHPCRAFPADYLFVGFYLPHAGRWHMEMTFIPKALWTGVWINLISIVLLLLIATKGKKIWRPRGSTNPTES